MTEQPATYMHWSEAEIAVLTAAVENGRTVRQTFDAGVLPGWSVIRIRNGFNTIRRRKEGICPGCGQPRNITGETRCDNCKFDAIKERTRLKAEGLCTGCRTPLAENPGASTTKCGKCRARIRTSRKKAVERRKNGRLPDPGRKRPVLRTQAPVRIFPWPHVGIAFWMAERAVGIVAGRPVKTVVDLFGGTGQCGLAVAEALEAASDTNLRCVYNDIHKGIAGIVSLLRTPQDTARLERMVRLQSTMDMADLVDTYLRPAETYDDRRHLSTAVHPAATKVLLDTIGPGKIAGLSTLSKADMDKIIPVYRAIDVPDLAGATAGFDTVLCRDYETVLDDHLSRNEPCFFVVDPPWPGASDVFEHALSLDRVRVLLDKLSVVTEMGHYWILSLGPERLGLEMLAASRLFAGGRTVPVIRHSGRSFHRETFVLSHVPVDGLLHGSDVTLDLRDFGLGPKTAVTVPGNSRKEPSEDFPSSTDGSDEKPKEEELIMWNDQDQVTFTQAAEELGIGKTTVRALIQAYSLPVTKPPGRKAFTVRLGAVRAHVGKNGHASSHTTQVPVSMAPPIDKDVENGTHIFMKVPVGLSPDTVPTFDPWNAAEGLDFDKLEDRITWWSRCLVLNPNVLVSVRWTPEIAEFLDQHPQLTHPNRYRAPEDCLEYVLRIFSGNWEPDIGVPLMINEQGQQGNGFKRTMSVMLAGKSIIVKALGLMSQKYIDSVDRSDARTARTDIAQTLKVNEVSRSEGRKKHPNLYLETLAILHPYLSGSPEPLRDNYMVTEWLTREFLMAWEYLSPSVLVPLRQVFAGIRAPEIMAAFLYAFRQYLIHDEHGQIQLIGEEGRQLKKIWDDLLNLQLALLTDQNMTFYAPKTQCQALATFVNHPRARNAKIALRRMCRALRGLEAILESKPISVLKKKKWSMFDNSVFTHEHNVQIRGAEEFRAQVLQIAIKKNFKGLVKKMTDA